MNLLQTMTIFAAASITMTGCVSTSIVSANQVSDKDLTCDSIGTRLGEVKAAKQFAQSKKGASGENVAAVLFFWPALLVNNSNTTQMINSMSNRESTLTKLYQDKNCKTDIPNYSTNEIQEKIKNKNTLESFG